MSAYANIARALGAEVPWLGCCARRSSWSRSTGSRSIIGDEPRPPAGWEVVVSTAHLHRIEGPPRAEFLAELVAAQPAIVVGGAHGKTTTAAMIAFVLRRRRGATRRGSSVASSRSSEATPESATGWLVVEGDESDRSIGALAAADRGGHEHRARPPRDLRVRGGAARVLRRVARGVPHVGSQLGARSRRARARRAGRAQPPERCGRARGARARGRRPRRGGARARAASRASAAASSSSANGPACA